MLKALLPFKDARHDGHVQMPFYLSPPTLFETVLKELCILQELTIASTSTDGTTVPRPNFVMFWNSYWSMSRYSTKERINFETATQSLQNFFQSKTARHYVVKIQLLDPYDGRPGRFINGRTSEELIVAITEGNNLYGKVETVNFTEMDRKPMEDM